MSDYGFTPRQAYRMYRRYAKELWPEYGITHKVKFSAKPFPKWYLELFPNAGMAETIFGPVSNKALQIIVDGTILPWLYEEELESLILHEMAHVIAGYDAEHGPEWQEIAVEIGANPSEFYIYRNWQLMPKDYQPTEWMLSMWNNEPTFA